MVSLIRKPRVPCEFCGVPFVPYRTSNRFCIKEACRRGRQRQRWAKWRDKDESNERVLEYQRRYRAKTHYGRKWEVKKKYGLEWDEYLALLDAFEHSCGICGRRDDICVDHCHTTGKVRGVLCRSHNSAIGLLGDNEEGVAKALDYLKSHGH